MKFVSERPYSDPDVAARKLVEIANSAEAVQDGSTSNRSMHRFRTNQSVRRPNTAPALIGRSARLALEARVRDLR
jgi:hypothetical protein